MTPAGIETATFRFVAQHLNHCTTAVPRKMTIETVIHFVCVCEVSLYACTPAVKRRLVERKHGYNHELKVLGIEGKVKVTNGKWKKRKLTCAGIFIS